MSALLEAINKEPTDWYILKSAIDSGYCSGDLEVKVKDALQIKISKYVYAGLNGLELTKLQSLQRKLENEGLLVYMEYLPSKPIWII
ncbi:hypothetical protein J4437_01755 [Candidatus Woesearchaeota archaeon]|nr:hypothetical protein [Candidatus Woesearchaeota archaeon]